MRPKIILFLCAILNLYTSYGQNTLNALILDSETKAPLNGATASVKGTTKGAVADTNGLVTISDIPDGSHKIEFRYIGYRTFTSTFIFPSALTRLSEILLEPEAGELEEVTVSSTRSTRTIQDIPTRVESIGIPRS